MFTEGVDRSYIVKKGDSLQEIALSNNISLIKLISLNNISNPNFIKVDQSILLGRKQELYFIGDDNFIAITKYNRSHFYAKAVYDLSQEF